MRRDPIPLVSWGDFCEIGNFDGTGSNHFIDSKLAVLRLQVNGTNRVTEKHNLEPFFQAIEHRVLDTVISSQAADENPFDAFLSEQPGERCSKHISGVESRVTIVVGRH